MATRRSVLRSIATSAWGPLTLFAVGQSVLYSVYIANGFEPSDTAMIVIESAPGLAIALWVVCDAHLGSRTPCCDFGMFTAMGMPAVPLWYVFRARGWRGMGTLAGLVALVLLPYFWCVALSLLLFDAP